jgi:CheY-like chemotaxis protein
MSFFGKPLMILLAEDDDGHATLIRRNLTRAGVVNDVVHVKDGREALDFLFRRGVFADRPKDVSILLLLDINMPHLSGVEVLRIIKADEATARTPVIMLTTTDDPREVEKCYALGCSVYITKPVQYESFVDAIRRLGMFLAIIQVPPVAGGGGAV